MVPTQVSQQINVNGNWKGGQTFPEGGDQTKRRWQEGVPERWDLFNTVFGPELYIGLELGCLCQ